MALDFKRRTKESGRIQPDIPLPPRPSEFNEKSHELFEFFTLWEDSWEDKKEVVHFNSVECKNELKSIFEKRI